MGEYKLKSKKEILHCDCGMSVILYKWGGNQITCECGKVIKTAIVDYKVECKKANAIRENKLVINHFARMGENYEN